MLASIKVRLSAVALLCWAAVAAHTLKVARADVVSLCRRLPSLAPITSLSRPLQGQVCLTSCPEHVAAYIAVVQRLCVWPQGSMRVRPLSMPAACCSSAAAPCRWVIELRQSLHVHSVSLCKVWAAQATLHCWVLSQSCSQQHELHCMMSRIVRRRQPACLMAATLWTLTRCWSTCPCW